MNNLKSTSLVMTMPLDFNGNPVPISSLDISTKQTIASGSLSTAFSANKGICIYADADVTFRITDDNTVALATDIPLAQGERYDTYTMAGEKISVLGGNLYCVAYR